MTGGVLRLVALPMSVSLGGVRIGGAAPRVRAWLGQGGTLFVQ